MSYELCGVHLLRLSSRRRLYRDGVIATTISRRRYRATLSRRRYRGDDIEAMISRRRYRCRPLRTVAGVCFFARQGTF